MSAASKKKHSGAHKVFQAGSDQLEVSALIAGAGNGRDIERRLGGGAGGEAEFNQEYNPTETVVESQDAAAKDLPEAQEAIGNEGPVTAGNADTPVVEQRAGRLARSILTPEEFDATLKAPQRELDIIGGGYPGYYPKVSNMPHRGRNVLVIVTRSVKPGLFSADFPEVIKHMFELAPTSITGLSTGFYELAGQLLDCEVNPCINVVERDGRVFDKALTEWARRFSDFVVSKKQSVPASQRSSQLQEEDVTINMFFIEPDDTGTKVAVAWSGKNVRPRAYTGISSMRNLHGTVQEHHLEIGLAGVWRRGEAVDADAQQELDKLFSAGGVIVNDKVMYAPV